MSDCSLCLTADVDGYCEVYNPRFIKKSRKDFNCSECRKLIPKGSSYYYLFSLYDGDKDECHTCIACEDIAGTFYCDTRVHKQLWEDIRCSDFFSQLNMECVGKLKTKEGRDCILERWAIWKGLKSDKSD